MQKHLYYAIVITFFSVYTLVADQQNLISVTQKDPLLVVALMIKNEGPVIDDTLRPLVEGGIDSFLIFDTGSTDNTIEKVYDFFITHSITNFAILQESFVNFAVSRNRALDLVDEYFPQATLILMPDAEWILRNSKDLLAFCKENKNDWHASYIIALEQSHSMVFYQARLIRRESHCRFEQERHEYLVSPSAGTVPSIIYFEYNPTSYGCEKSYKRWKSDLDVLLKAYAESPTNPRLAFYLAQTYACLGDDENAFRFYERRTQLPSWPEEDFQAMYRLAQIAEDLASRDSSHVTPYDWSLAQWYYLKAYSMRPTRIEPLIRIALHYLYAQDYANAYLFAEIACEVPYPEQDILFVEKNMYVYTRYDIIAQCGIHVGEYAKGEWAIKKALDNQPDTRHLQDLLIQYLNH
jgi:glycosyltransferase involved in cell wall biosynthesis